MNRDSLIYRDITISILISIVVIFLSSLVQQSYQFSITVGLLSLVLTSIWPILSYIRNIKEDLSNEIKFNSDLVLMIEQSRSYYHIPGFESKVENIIDDLRSLSNGILKLFNRQSIYEVDAAITDSLQENDSLLATVPAAVGYESHITSPDFKRLIDSQVRAAQRGVLVKRIYLFHSEETFSNKTVQSHLNYISKLGIKVEYVIREKSNRRNIDQIINQDFVIFGNRIVSPGSVKFPEMLFFEAYFTTDTKAVNEYLIGWTEVENIATEYSPSNFSLEASGPQHNT